MQKLIAATLAVALAGAGAVVGLAGAEGPDDAAPPADRKAPGPKPEPPEKAARADRLPAGPAPTQVLARLADGVVIVSFMTHYYRPVTQALPDGRHVTSYALETKLTERRFAAEEVTIQNTKGKAMSKVAVEKVFPKDRPAVAALDGKPVDPLHLRILKDDVPVLILPAPAPAMPPAVVMPVAPIAPPGGPAPVMPPPAIPPVPQPAPNPIRQS